MATMNAKDITLVGSQSNQQKFCQAWPTVKTGLELLLGIIKNPIAKAAVQIVISAGDAISKKICG